MGSFLSLLARLDLRLLPDLLRPEDPNDPEDPALSKLECQLGYWLPTMFGGKHWLVDTEHRVNVGCILARDRHRQHQ